MNASKHFVTTVSILVVGALLLLACGTAAPTATAPAKTGEEPAQIALQALAAQLNLEPAAIQVTSAEPAQWPDACLGIQAVGEMCAAVIVPGYRVVLAAEGQSYEYRTNEDGSQVVAVPKLALTWQEGEQCQEAVLSPEGASYGPCGGSLTSVPLANGVQAQELAGFAREFTPFKGETPVGELSFFGTGERAMSPAEQRMLAEWARVAVEEVGGGSVGPVIAWHREGGIASFCDDLAISTVGEVVATSCKGAQPAEVGRYRLAPDELEQLYTWVDKLVVALNS